MAEDLPTEFLRAIEELSLQVPYETFSIETKIGKSCSLFFLILYIMFPSPGQEESFTEPVQWRD